MIVASRPLLLILVELGYFLCVLQLSGSTLVSDVPAGVAASALLVGVILIAALLGPRRGFARWAAAVEGGIGVLMVMTGIATLAGSNASGLAGLGIVGCGGVFIAEALARRRPRPA